MNIKRDDTGKYIVGNLRFNTEEQALAAQETADYFRALRKKRPARKRHYVGIRNGVTVNGGQREVFAVNFKPRPALFGYLYSEIIGPFRTKTGAQLVRDNRAHTVAEAETIVERVRTLAQSFDKYSR